MKTPDLRVLTLAWLLIGGTSVLAEPAAAQSPAPTNTPPPAAAPQTPAVAPAPTPAPPQAAPAATNAPAAPPEAPKPPPANAAPPATPPADASAGAAPETSAPTAATNAPVRNIRFQFDGIPYMDVIERFAQMADKPLVTDTNVLGTLTFNDPTPYSYPEALDMLNVMLSMKGTMLVESGRYLQLVPFKQLPQMPLRILRGVDQTGDVRPGEVITVVLPVKNVDSKEIADAVTAMLSNAGSLAPLSKGRGIIVTDRLGTIQRIRFLLSQIDSESTVDRQMKTYTLLHASGSIVCDLLNRTFGVATAPKRTQYNPNSKQLEVLPPDPNDYITAVYDEASRTLVLFGPNERLALAEDLINRFEQKDGGPGDVRIYYPNSIKPDELAALIRQAIPGVAAPGDASATKARLIPDVPQNRLIVSAPIPGQLDEIEALITRLDKGVVGAKGGGQTAVRSTTVQLTRVFHPRTAEMTNIAQILTTALTRRSPNGVNLTTATVSAEPGSQTIVVSGSPGDIQIAADIVSQVEAGGTEPASLETQFIELGSAAEAKRILPLVEQLYQDQAPTQIARAKILADPDAGRLIVTGTAEDNERIAALVEAIRGDRPQAQERRLQIIPLKATKVDTVARSLTELVTERMNEKRFQDLTKPLIIADPANNRFLVTATDDQFKEIEQIFATLDQAPDKSQREMTLVPVRSKSASEIISFASQLIAQLGEEQTNPQLVPRLMPDPSGKQIIVLATPRDRERILALIQQFDGAAATAVARQIKGVDLLSHSAADFAPIVQQLYQEQLRGLMDPVGGPATLLADPRNNRIMVGGTTQEIARVEALIKQLESAAPTTASRQLKGVDLLSHSAADLTPMVQQLYQEQIRGATDVIGGPATLLPDAKNNRIMVSGTAKEIARVEALIKQLDGTASTAAPRQFRGIDLARHNPTDLLPLVQQLYQEQTRNATDLIGGPATLLADPKNNRIMASGTEKEIARVEAIVKELDGAGSTTAARQFKGIDLTSHNPTDLMPLVQQLYQEQIKNATDLIGGPATLLVDPKNNRIMVSGTEKEIARVEALIKQLDSAGSSAAARQFKGIDLTRHNPTDLMPLVQQLYQEQTKNATDLIGGPATLIADPKNNRIMVSGTEKEIARVEALVKQLDGAGSTAAARQFKGIDLASHNPTDLMPLVQQLYQEQIKNATDLIGGPATLLVDARNNRIMVSGTEKEIARVEAIVKQLDGAGPTAVARQFKGIDLASHSPNDLMSLVQQLYQEQIRGATDLIGGPATLLADPKNNRIMVSGTEREIARIEAIVRQLDGPGATSPLRQFRTVDLVSHNATEFTPTIQQLYQEQLRGTVEPPGGPATLIADPKNNRIMISGSEKELARVEALIKQFDGSRSGATTRQFKGVELFSRTAAEFTPMVQQLYQEQLRGLSDPIGGPATLIAEPRNNRIMVSGSDKEIARVETIIRQLDPADLKPAREETRVLRLKSALAQDLGSLVEKSLGTRASKVKVLVDTRSNSLVISGEAESVDAAAKVVAELDTRAEDSPREMRIIELRQAEASSILTLVNSLFAEMMRDQRGPDYTVQTRIIPDAAANRLIATGPRAELSVVAELVTRLDQAPEATGSVRVFKLINADALQVVGVVSNAMLKFDLRNQPIRRVAISAERESNSIIVSGQRNDLKDAEAIIQRLDNEGLDAPIGSGLGSGAGTGLSTGLSIPSSRTRELRVIDVKSDDPDALAALATRVFVAQNSGRLVTNQVSITVAPNGKRLLVLAPPTVLPQIEQVISTLDDKPDGSQRELQTIEVKNANANDLLPAVQRIYAEQTQGRSGKPASFYPDASGTRFAVFATRDQTTQIRQIVETLATQDRPGRETRIFDIGRLAEAQRILPLAQQLYRDHVANDPQIGPPDAQIVSDNRSGRLIVTARTNQLPALEQILNRLQSLTITNQAPRESKAFDVGNAAEVQRLLPLVQQLYQDQWKDRTETDPADAQIVGDARGGRLVVTGKPDHIRAIEKILEQFGSTKAQADPSKPAIKTSDLRDTRIFDLTTANAPELATTVRTLYLEQAKSRLGTLVPDTLILPDVGGNRIIVVGEPIELDCVAEIIQKLDKVAAQSASARIFKLKSADPAKVAEIMTTAMVRYDGYGRIQRRVTISVDAKSRILIATGDPKELQSASVIIEQLDQSLGERPERKMKVLTLKEGSVGDFLPRMRQLYTDQLTNQPDLATTDVLMLEDFTSNQLILAGTDAQIGLLEKILGELQAAAPARGPRQTRTIDIGVTEEMTRLLPLVQQIYQERVKNLDASDAADAKILTDAKNARFLVTGRTNHLDLIDNLVKELRAQDLSRPRDTRIYDLTTASAAELSATVRSLYLDTARTRPGAMPQETQILPDAAANRLIVTGTADELAAVEEIIRKLDKVTGQTGTVRVFKLKSADPAKVMEILGNALTSYDSYGRSRRRVGVTVDPKTRTIIVAGDPKELQALQNAAVIIEQLDSALGQQAERKLKVLTLKQAKAGEMLPKVRQIYSDQIATQPDLGMTDILLLEDTPGNQLILAGNDAQIALVENIVTELEAATTRLGDRQTRMIEIGQVDEMNRLMPLVQQIYKDHWKNKSPADPPDATITADSKTARLIVTARTNHIAEIEGILKDLRAGQTLVPRDTRIVDLTTANAVELATTVKALYLDQLKARPTPPPAEATVVPDAIANRLVLSGPTNELEVVEDIVRKLDKVGAQSAGVRVFKLKKADPEKVLTILQSAMVRYDSYGRSLKRVSMSVDPKSRTLILTGDPKELQGASVILDQLDSLGDQPERRMKVRPVKAGKASELMSRVKTLYDDQVKAQPALGTTDLLILDDATSNQLILAGTDDQLKLVEDIASQLEASTLAEEPRETRVYELSSTSAAELATTVKSLYQESAKHRPVTPANQALILPDINANRLIVSAQTNELAVVDEIIQKIDKTETQSGRTRVFRLKQAEASQVATILSSALVQVTPYGRSVPRVTVGTDVSNNLLIVSGAPQDLQGAAMIIEQMDSILAKEPRQLRVIGLTNGLATEVATRVKSLYQDQIKGRPKAGGADAVILGDEVGNRLIITASDSHIKIIEDIVSKLEETAAGTTRQTRVVTLQRNSATSIAAMLTQLFAREIRSEDPTQRLVVGASGDDRVVVIEGSGEMLKRVEDLVASLDGEGAKGGIEVRTYALPDGNASELADSLARLFAERSAAAPTRYGMPQGGGGLGPRFEADPTGNALMVAATKDQFEAIGKLLDELKQSAAVSNEIRTFVLKNGDPDQMATLLEQMLGEEGPPRMPGASGMSRRPRWRAGFGGGPSASGDNKPVHIAPAPSLHAVVVQGPPDKLALAEKIIQNLDRTDSEGQTVIQTVHLKKAQAESLADAVAKNIASKGTQGRIQRVTVTAVDGANNLLISGPGDAVQEVMKLVRELDTESEDDEIEVRIYKLENGQAREVSRVVQQLLQNVTRARERARTGRRLALIAPTVSVDERSNSLVISATASHFRMIDKMLAQLDKAETKSDRDVQFVWLKNAKAIDVSLTLKAVFEGRPEAERPTIDSDSMANSLTIIARRADLPQIQDIIGRLDETTKDSTIQVRMRTIESVPVEQMVRMLQNIYPQMVGGTLRTVDKIQPPRTRSYRGDTNAPPAAAGEEGSTTPEVVLAVDKDANTLLMSGPASELDQIDRILSDLSMTFFGNEAELRLFSLQEADPVIVARTLNDLFRTEQVRVEQPVQRPGEVRTVVPPPKLSAVAEPRSRSVIVRAKPTDFALVESLINQLDSAGLNAQLDYRVVALTNAQPQKVLPLVQQMVTQLNLVRPGEPLTVSVDARTRGILVVARDTILNQVEKMIHSLDTETAYEEAEVLVVSLKKASAPQLAQVLQSMLRPAEQSQVTPEARELQDQVRKLKIRNDKGDFVHLDLAKPIKIMADPVSGGTGGANRLVLTSTADNLKALAAVVEMMDTLPILDGVDVRLVVLEHADAATVSQTLNSIFAQGARLASGRAGPGEPESAAGKALAHPLNVAVDTRSNSLVLSGRPESIQLALRVIDDLDRQIERFVTEVRLFRLKHASAIRLMPMLQAVFAEGPSIPGSEGLSTMVTRLLTRTLDGKPKSTEAPKARQALVIQADDLSNILVVAARSDALPIIEDVIGQLDIPAASGLESVRIYPLNHADASALQRLLTTLYTGPNTAGMRNEDKPNITIDERSNSLIVSGNTKAFGIIDGLLAKLDQKLPFDLRDIRILPLEHADATATAGTLQRLMDARLTQRAALQKQSADSLKVIVMADERSNSLLVGGSKDSFELVESLAIQLDQAEPALSGKIRLIPLAYADARTLAASLTTLFTQRYAAARSAEQQRNRPVIVPDPRANALMVAAGQDDSRTLDDLIAKLDQDLKDPSMVVTVVALRHNDCAKLAATLEGVFSARQRVRTIPGQPPAPQDLVRVETDTLNNALIVYASKENQETARGLIEKLDTEPDTIGGVIEVFVLEYADAQRISSMLRTLVQQGLYRPGAPATSTRANSNREALAVTVDPRSNTLIVSASPENLVVVKEVIHRVDTKDFAGSGDMKVYALKKARASSLATVLEQFFRAKRAGEAVAINAAERTVPVAVIPDDRSNLLLVTGSKEGLETMDRLVDQLDGEDVFSRMNFNVFPLKKATALKLQGTLRQIVANRPPRVRGEPLEPINIVADQWVNALLVGASTDDLTLVSSLIEKLDVEMTDQGIAVQVLPLVKADARRVATTVQALFREGTPGLTLPVMVNADERLNALVVSAGETDVKRIAELVQKLDTDQVARVSEIKIFPLRFARAESLSTILNTALNTRPTPLNEMSPNTQSLLQFITRTETGSELVTSALKESVLITPDARMNSLIVSGPADYMSLLDQIITRLDNSAPQQAKIRVFNLQNADVHQMSTLIMQLFRMQAIPGQAVSAQRSIQYTLMRPPALDDDQPDVQTDEAVASATIGTAEQSALTVTVDPRTNSLLVGGTDHYVELVGQIVQSLDACPARERKSELYRLRNAQAEDVSTALRSFLDQERQRITQVLGSDAVGTTQRLLDREVAIVAEKTSNTLLIATNPRFFDELHLMVEELDQPRPQVIIQVVLAEVGMDSINDLGVEWRSSGSIEGHTIQPGTDFGLPAPIAPADIKPNTYGLSPGGGFSSVVTGDKLNFYIRALQNKGQLQILSRPQILTSDNKIASINVGQRVPVVRDSRTGYDASSTTVNSYSYEEVGVTLTVTPRIGPDNIVRMEVGTTNATLSSSGLKVSSTLELPVFNQRRASTTVSVQNGQTVIIGGLIGTVDDIRNKRVPILGSLPLLGVLFRSTSKSTERRELLIFLTPEVILNAQNRSGGAIPAAMDLKSFTDREVRNSTIRSGFKPDALQRRVLDPIFPPNGTNAPTAAPSTNTPPATTKAPAQSTTTSTPTPDDPDDTL